MSGGLSVTLPFGDSERTFRLGIEQWRRIQDKCDAGPDEIASRLSPTVEALRNKLSIGDSAIRGIVGRWRVDDVREPIYQGLLGGGNSPIDCARLMAECVDGKPLRSESLALAFAIVMASLNGVPDDPLGESMGEAAEIDPPEEKSASAKSTNAADGRVSRRKKSTG